MSGYRYGSPEYSRMVAWVENEMTPYILFELFPEYTNPYLNLVLEGSGEQHKKTISATNTTPDWAVRAEDIEALGDMIAELRNGRLVDRIFTSSRAFREVQKGKVVKLSYYAGARTKADWTK